jgi:hypothetical protein
MAAEILGHVTCPHCGNDQATVHREAKGKRALYYRCYSAPGSIAMRCGTVQIRGPQGQVWINANITTIASGQAENPAADPIAAPATKKPEQQPAKKPGMFANFWKDDGDL